MMDIEHDTQIRFCRGCFATTGISSCSSNIQYKKLFTNLTNIAVENNFVDFWLCFKCSMLFNKIFTFKRKAETVDSLLREYSNNSKIREEQLINMVNAYSNVYPPTVFSTVKTLNTCLICPESALDVRICFDEGNHNSKHKENLDNIFENKLVENGIKLEDEKIIDGDMKFEEVSLDHDISDNSNSDDEVVETISENIQDDPICYSSTKSTKKPKKKIRLRERKKFDHISQKSKDLRSSANSKKSVNKIKKRKWEPIFLDMNRVTIIELSEEQQTKEIINRKNSENFLNAKYKCEHCVKVFPYEKSLQTHMMRHNKSFGCYECDLCHQRFIDKRRLKSHFTTHAKRYICRICNRQLHFKITMLHHLMKHDNKYLCRVCGLQSLDKTTNRLHQKTHSDLQTFKCVICSKILSSKHDYGIHIRRHQGDMPFSCTECGKCFQTGSILAAHKAVHSPTRNFYCALCDVSFKTKRSLETHMKKSLKHIDPELLKYPCSHCTKKFASENQLDTHVDRYHLRNARLTCDICPAQFVSNNGLRNHRRRKHEGLKPILSHVCETCGRGFSTKALVTNHLRTHTGEQPFECETCHRKFSQKSAMRTHIKLVHLKIKRTKNKVHTLSFQQNFVSNME